MKGWGFAAAALIAPALSFPSAKAMVPLLFAAVAFEAVAHFRRGGAVPLPSLTLLWPLGALLLWGLASALWSVDPSHSLRVALALTATCAAGVVGVMLARTLDATQRRRVALSLLAGLGIAVVLFGAEYLTNAGLHFALRGGVDALLDRTPEPLYPIDYRYVLNNGATVVALLSWPAAVAAWRRRGWPGALAALAAGAVVALPSDSAIAGVALVAGGAVMLLSVALPRLTAILLAAGMSVAILLMPAAISHLPRPDRLVESVPTMSNSAYHRLFVWQFATHRIGDRPLFGWGLDGARSVPGGEVEMVTARPLPGGGIIETRGELLPLHPHNAGLQLWLELGAVGALLAALFAARTVRAVTAAASTRVVRAAGYAQTAAAFLIAGAGYGLWQSWWLAALWLAAALYAATTAGDGGG